MPVPNPIIPQEPMAAAANVDAVAAARAVLADRHRAFTVSTRNLWAICEALVEAVDNPQPAITDELAIATRAFIAVHEGFAERSKALGEAQAQAVSDAVFKTFKTHFEQEFPND